MVLKLYGNPMSTCTKRVATVLHEKKVSFELVVIDFAKGEHKAPDFVKNQPFGQVPYIDDDGFVLFESRAICRYIEAKYPSQGTSLASTDLKKKALIEQAASIEQSNFDVFASAAVAEKVFKPMFGQKTDDARLQEYLTRLEDKLKGYETILSKQKYLAGDDVTLPDLFHLPYGSMLPMTGSDPISKFPNVSRWFKELQSRPSWQAFKDGIQSTTF